MRTVHREDDESRPMLNLMCRMAFQVGDDQHSLGSMSSRVKADIKARKIGMCVLITWEASNTHGRGSLDSEEQ